MRENLHNQIDIIVEARMSSSRLPGKVLLDAVGKPLLQLMIERLQKIEKKSNIIVATTENEEDNVIVSLCEQLEIPYFRGSENDVLGRVLAAAEKYCTDVIVEITSDNPLIDPMLCQDVIEIFLEKEDDVDFVSNDVGAYRDDFVLTYPLGLCNTKVFKRTLLESVDRLTNHPMDREHVVNFIIKNSDKYRIFNVEAEGIFRRSDIRVTLDYPEDYEVIKSVFEGLYPYNTDFTGADIINYLDQNHYIRDLNKNCTQARYEY